MKPTPIALACLLASSVPIAQGALAQPMAPDPVLGAAFAPGDPAVVGRFPRGFMLGVATAAQQVEGYTYNNDFFAYQLMCRDEKLRRRVGVHVAFGPFVLPIKIQDMCERFDLAGAAVRHREPAVLDSDLDRTRALGLNTYRFSLEWSRIEPREGEFNNDVLRAYRRDILAMRRRGLEPLVGLHHFTLPLWISNPLVAKPETQGFMNPQIVTYFRRYTRRVVAALGDVVRHWVTLNEPVATQFTVGYVTGVWPPGQVPPSRAHAALKHMALCHAVAYDEIHAAYRRRGAPRPRVGFAHHMIHVKVSPPLKVGPLELVDNTSAAQRFHYFMNELFVDAVHDGCFRLRRSDRCDERLRPHLARRLDFLGINYYRSGYVFFDLAVAATVPYVGGRMDFDQSKSPYVGHSNLRRMLVNDMGWELSPDGLYRLLRHMHARTGGLPIVVTENGYPQNIAKENERDDVRAPYLLSHLQAVLRALRDGVRVEGYVHWSLLDNWEWQDGYQPNARFGLFAVDRSDCRASLKPGTREVVVEGPCVLPRRPTRGASAFAAVARAGGVTREILRAFGTVTPDGSRIVRP